MRVIRYLVLLIALLLIVSACDSRDRYGFYNEYPYVAYSSFKELSVGMTKESVEDVIGKGLETFTEDDNGRLFTVFYKTEQGDGYNVISIRYDNQGKVKQLNAS